MPGFYREAIAVDRSTLERHSDAMLRRAAQLSNDVAGAGSGRRRFRPPKSTAGWPSICPKNYPGALPPDLQEPRVSIQPHEIVLACRLREAGLSSVVFLTIDPYLQQPNVLALRVRKVRVGSLPLPLTKILDGIAEGVRHSGLRIEWRQAEGDPVA